MKVDLSKILIAHWETLRNVGKDQVSLSDIFLFYVLPVILGVVVWQLGITFSPEVFSVSISVFAIFSALLFSVQVAMYGVFKSDRKPAGDKILAKQNQQRAEDARMLLREVNTNVSYLIFLSCLAVSVFLLFFTAGLPCQLEASVSIVLYVHFLLTVAMVLKRAHEVFDAEYSAPFV